MLTADSGSDDVVLRDVPNGHLSDVVGYILLHENHHGESIPAPSLKRKASEEGDGGRPSKKSRSNSQAPKLSQEHTAGQDSPEIQNTQNIQDTQNTQDTPLAASFLGEQEKFQNSVLSFLAIPPAGRALSTFQSALELLCAFRDAIKAHRSLFLDVNVLHRDVSKNSIIVTDPKEAGRLSTWTSLWISMKAARTSQAALRG